MTNREKTQLMDYLLKQKPEATVQDFTGAIKEREEMELVIDIDRAILQASPKISKIRSK